MKTYVLTEAGVELSRLVERALAGEPQRVTRYGKEAVVIVSEDEWRKRCRTAPTLGALGAVCARRPYKRVRHRSPLEGVSAGL
jgi:prevent-host-death family protein